MNTIEHLYHFTKSIDILIEIFENGFKPSYAKEQLDARNILLPMISFSNILLRDVGDKEVLFYGNYAIGFQREWGIERKLNPVLYTYPNGDLQNGVNTIIEHSVFVSAVNKYHDYFKINTEKQWKFSNQIQLTNTSKEALNIIDYISLHYDEELVEHLSNWAKKVHYTNLNFIRLTKPYEVINSKGEKFIAYNDREWRRTYPDLEIFFEDTNVDEYKEWVSKQKPHFHENDLILDFFKEEIKVIMVKEENEIPLIEDYLSNRYSTDIKALTKDNLLKIGTKEELIKLGF